MSIYDWIVAITFVVGVVGISIGIWKEEKLIAFEERMRARILRAARRSRKRLRLTWDAITAIPEFAGHSRQMMHKGAAFRKGAARQ